MNIYQRHFLLAVVAGSALAVAPESLRAAEAPQTIAAHQVIRLPQRSGHDEAPVITAVALNPTGELVASAGDDHLVRLWRTDDGQVVRQLRGHDDWVRTLAFRPSGNHLASAGDDGRILVWDVTSGAIVHQIGGRKLPPGEIEPRPGLAAPPGTDCIYSVLYSPDSKRLVAAGYHRSVRLYHASTGQLQQTLDCPVDNARAVAFSPDGSLLAAGGCHGQIRIWNTADGSVARDLDAGPARIRAVAFSRDGELVAAAGDGPLLRIWDVATGTDRHAFVARPGRILALVFLRPNEVATGSSDNVIRIWNLDTEHEVYRLVGHEGSVSALEFNAAGSALVSGSFDTTVRFWKVPGGATAATARQPSPKKNNR